MSTSISELTLSPAAIPSTPTSATRPATPAASEPAVSKAYPNPTLRLDAALGMVVLEFRDDAGSVKSSIPTQRELQAYRSQAPAEASASPPASPQRTSE